MKLYTKFWVVVLTMPIWVPIAFVWWTIEDIWDHIRK